MNVPRAARATKPRTKSGQRRPRVTTPQEGGGMAVLRNRPFLLLWLAQLSTQVGGNMVMFGLFIIIGSNYSGSKIAISILLLSFLVPAILFSAIAGVFVDRVDKRHMLLVTNVLRGVAFVLVFLVGNNLLLLYLLMILVSTITTFFGPAEASMIPFLVPKGQLLAANGLFTLTTNASFALGFALFGPFLVALASPQLLILVVAALYFMAAAFCWTLPSSLPSTAPDASAGGAVTDAERAVETMFGELVEGLTYIRDHRNVGWTLFYLGLTGALIGILAVLGPDFANKALGLGDKGLVVVVLPLGLGIVTGIVTLNAYGCYFPRRRAIEAGLIVLGLLLALLSCAGPISRFLEARVAGQGFQDASQMVSLLSMVIAIAFIAGTCYAIVAISAQTQLQEDLPEDVRGRVFGVLNMLISISSLLPIIVVAPAADLVGTAPILAVVSLVVCASGIASVIRRGPLRPVEMSARAGTAAGGPADAILPTSQSECAPGTPIGQALSKPEIPR
ncbi:MAG TPA: MFS transporter [Candidatus Limnocylindrales bacterium]